MTSEKIKRYIEENLPKCIRERKEDNLAEELYGLPYPYTVPSVNSFDELYYWDTYFLNKIYQFTEPKAQMRNNVDNMLYMVERFGHMGNSNRTYHIKISQPPLLSEMVKDVYNSFADKQWLKKAYETLKKEYTFWVTERMTEIGLNQYGCSLKEEDVPVLAEGFSERLGYRPDMTEYDMARQYLICCEAGLDLCYRWGMEGHSYVQVDLNSILYGIEKNMEYFSDELGTGESELWRDRAKKRKKLMNEFLLSEDKLFYDYSLKTKELGMFNDACVYPLFFGLANQEQAKAALENLGRIETDHGITVCEKHDVKGVFQWAYPNAWPCIQYFTVFGLERYGYTDAAVRIGKKYINMLETVFEETGELWEKYNAVEGNNKPVSNSQTTMLGWTAGTYLSISRYLEEKEKL